MSSISDWVGYYRKKVTDGDLWSSTQCFMGLVHVYGKGDWNVWSNDNDAFKVVQILGGMVEYVTLLIVRVSVMSDTECIY